jgi:hypothetical protein
MKKFRKNTDEGHKQLKMEPLKKEKYKYQQFLSEEEKLDLNQRNGYNFYRDKSLIKDIEDA